MNKVFTPLFIILFGLSFGSCSGGFDVLYEDPEDSETITTTADAPDTPAEDPETTETTDTSSSTDNSDTTLDPVEMSGMNITLSGEEQLYSNSLAYSPDGTLYTVYCDDTYSQVKAVEITDSGTVDLGTVGTVSDYGTQNTKIAFDSSSNIYVLYSGQGTTGAYEINVKTYDGSSWNLVGGTAVVSIAKPETANLGVSGYDGTPYVSYRDSANGGNSYLTVKAFYGSDWGHVGSSSQAISSDTIWNNLTFTDNSGNIFTIYKFPNSTGTGELNLTSCDDTNWNDTGVFSEAQVNFFDVAPDTTGFYIAYNNSEDDPDDGGGGRIKVKHYDGSTWETLGSGFSQGSATWIDTALSPSGVLYVAYTDVSLDNRIALYRYIDDSWEEVGDENTFTVTDCSRVSLACLSDDTVLLSAFSTANGTTEVLRYKF